MGREGPEGRCWQELLSENKDLAKLLCRRRGIIFAPEREGERGKTGGRGRKSQGSSGRLGCWVFPTCAPHLSPPFSTLLWTPSLTPSNSPDLRGPSASGFQLGLAHGRCCQESRGQGRGWGGYSLAPFQPLPEVTSPAERSPPPPPKRQPHVPPVPFQLGLTCLLGGRGGQDAAVC